MKPKQILLIDDEKDFTTLIKEHLEAITGHDVYTASNGKDGLETAKRIKPDLIILDVLMPKMDGFQVLESLKKDADTLHIPVIMLSARDDDKSMMQAARLYDELYLTKPVDVDELKSKIEEVFKWRGER